MVTSGAEAPQPTPEQQQFVNEARGLFLRSVEQIAPNAGWLARQPFGLVEVRFAQDVFVAEESGAQVRAERLLVLSAEPHPDRFDTPMKDWDETRRKTRVIPTWFGAPLLTSSIDLSAVDPRATIEAEFTQRKNGVDKRINAITILEGESPEIMPDALEMIDVLRKYVRDGHASGLDNNYIDPDRADGSIVGHRFSLRISPELHITPNHPLPSRFLTALVYELIGDSKKIEKEYDSVLENWAAIRDGQISDEIGDIIGGKSLEDAKIWLSRAANERTLIKDAIARAYIRVYSDKA